MSFALRFGASSPSPAPVSIDKRNTKGKNSKSFAGFLSRNASKASQLRPAKSLRTRHDEPPPALGVSHIAVLSPIPENNDSGQQGHDGPEPGDPKPYLTENLPSPTRMRSETPELEPIHWHSVGLDLVNGDQETLDAPTSDDKEIATEMAENEDCSQPHDDADDDQVDDGRDAELQMVKRQLRDSHLQRRTERERFQKRESDLSTQVANLSAQLAQLKATEAERVTRTKALTRDVEELRHLVVGKTQSAQRHENENNTLRTELSAARAREEQLSRDIHTVRGVLLEEQKRSRCQSVQHEILVGEMCIASKDAADEFQQKEKALLARQKQLEKSLEEKTRAIASFKEHMQLVKTGNEASQKKLKDTLTSLSDARTRLNNLSKEYTRLGQQNAQALQAERANNTAQTAELAQERAKRTQL